MKTINVYCSWCIAEGLNVAPLHTIEVENNVVGDSHGICNHHADKMIAEWNLYLESHKSNVEEE